MERKEILGIIFTLVFGFFFGMYLYIADFMTLFNTPDVPQAAEINEFILTGEAYGGCRAACPSFQILADGTYRYLYTPAAGEEQTIKEGMLPRGLQTAINANITAPALQAQSEEIQPSFCNSYTDGIDVRYDVTIAAQEYVLDTCGTDIDTETALWQTLVKIWNYFETGDV